MNPDIPSFESLFNLEEIQKIQDSFAAAPGIAAIIRDITGRPITKPSNSCRLCTDIIRRTEKGLLHCIQTAKAIGRGRKKGPMIKPCPDCGLWSAGITLQVAGKHIASWYVGQVRVEDVKIDIIRKYAGRIGADADEFFRAMEEVPAMSLDQFRNICRSLFLIANQLSEKAYLAAENDRLFQDSKKEFDKRIMLEEDKRQLETLLLRSQKMEAIGTLAGGIAHDFNNILFPVTGFSEMIMEALPEKSLLRDQMQFVLDGVYRAKNLVQQILTLSLQTEYDYDPLQIQMVLKQVLKPARLSLPVNIKIRTDIPDKVGMIMADPKQLYQIAVNLITNAREAMEKKGGELSVVLSEIRIEQDGGNSPEMPPGPYACLKITDTGCGMGEDILERIFEPYFTTKTMGKGTGLGLAVVQGIVKKLQGRIVVHSKIGKGSEFLIYLPQIKSGKSDSILPQIIHLAAHQRNPHILLVDGTESVLKFLNMNLSRIGFKVTCQKSSFKALELFQKAPGEFDLVITDNAMPDLPGDDFISRIKKIRPDILVILYIDSNENGFDDKAPYMAPDKILIKPVMKKELIETIIQLIGQKWAGDKTILNKERNHDV